VRLAASTLGVDDTEHVNILIGRMMFDPELAAHLLTRKVETADTPAWNRKLTYLLTGQEGYRSVTEGQEAEKPQKPPENLRSK
jgi:hypothetical protein